MQEKKGRSYHQRRTAAATLLVAAIVAALLLAALAAAQGDSPAVDWWVIAGGGRSSSSAGLEFRDTIGQPIIGTSAAGEISVQAGYWHKAMPPRAVADLQASISGDYLRLDWSTVTEDTDGNAITSVTYHVYRAANQPFFYPGAPYATGLVDPTYTDPDDSVIEDPANSYYYVVKAIYGPLVSGASNRAGVFAYALVPGAAP